MDIDKDYELQVERVMKLRDDSITGRKEARERTEEVQRYIHHDPFTDKEKTAAEENAKPLMRYNILISKLQTIIGQEQANRRKTKIIAGYGSEEDTVRLLSDHFDYIREIEDLDDKELRALADGLLYPTSGWIRRSLELNEMAYLTFKYALYDTLNVHPDASYKENDLSDCKYIAIDDWLTIDAIKNKFGVSDIDDSEYVTWWRDVEGTLDDQTQREQEGEYKLGEKYLVVQLEERRTVPADIVILDGEVYKLPSDEVKKLQKAKRELTLLHHANMDRIFVTTIVPHFKKLVIQDEPVKYETTEFSMTQVSSFDWFMEKRRQPSWGYLLLDPQDRINKGKSQEVDYMIQRLGGKWHTQENEKKAMEALRTSAGDPNAIIPYKSLKNKAIRDTGQADGASVQIVQNGVMSDMAFMEEISNITQSMQGKGGKSGESGALFDMKRSQSLVSTNPYYELKAKQDERIVRDYIKLAPEVFFESNRTLEIADEKGSLRYEMVNLQIGENTLKNVREVSARVILDDAENVPNRLQRAFNENIALAQMLIDAGYPPEQIPFMLIIKHSTVRDKNDWIASLEKGQRIMANRQANREANEELSQMMNVAGKQ